MIMLVSERWFLGLVEAFGDLFSFSRSQSFEVVNGG